MKEMNRREFLNTSVTAGGVLAASAFIKDLVNNSPNGWVNVAVVGISGDRPRVRGMIDGRGMGHVRGDMRSSPT